MKTIITSSSPGGKHSHKIEGRAKQGAAKSPPDLTNHRFCKKGRILRNSRILDGCFEGCFEIFKGLIKIFRRKTGV
jgi:hypothetical protein